MTSARGGANPSAPARPGADTYTPIEAAAKLGVCVETVYRMIRSGTFPAPVLRIGARQMRIPRDALDAVLAEGSADDA